jgi:Asp-tRNA(Asn)/Glu-tRNA(Gln) amidotransferase A subunit family amidase
MTHAASGSIEQTVAHYGPSIDGRDPTDLYAILLEGRDVGMIQTYLVGDYPDWAAVIDVTDEAAGLDLFLAEPELLGKGLGTDAIRSFVTEIVFAREATRACVADPDVESHFKQAIAALRDVADLELDVPFPDLPYRDAVGVIVDAEGAAALRDLIESGKVKQLRDASDRVGGYAMMMTRAVDYVDAMRSRVAMRAELDALLSRFDALVAPTRTRLARPLADEHRVR